METVLQVEQLTKRYGATTALDRVTFAVTKGTTHAIIGENGAGKSTLIKSLSGLQVPDAGTMSLDGELFAPGNLGESRRSGVSTAFQDLSLLSNLTVAENLSLPKLGRSRVFVRRKENEDAAAGLLAEFDLPTLSPAQKVGELSLAERQKLEIVRAVSHRPKLLLLDEPSAALPDVEWLYALIEKISSPELTILYISHRLAEIRDLCQSATVLRNGGVVDTVRLSDVDDGVVFSLMGGASEEHAKSQRTSRVAGAPAIQVSGLRGDTVRDVSFTLHDGEILGVAALEGQGQAETFRMLAGVSRPSGGTISVGGKSTRFTTPAGALRSGISFVAEERKAEGIMPGISTLANITISSLDKTSTFGLAAGPKEFQASLPFARKVDLDERYLRMDIDELSGGNQQKAILARSLMKGSKYLLLYDPSRGVDVGTKSSVYDMMEEFTEAGGAVLWYSTDLSELVAICDRVICFYKGSVVSEVPGHQTDVEALLQAITGHVDGGRVSGR
ncbi:MAG: ribose transport system ATP-binding protein [Kribbellaceae bacterium]|nr:ribose transport system ATP-binding protein [Kribbellaceae bacterium]